MATEQQASETNIPVSETYWSLVDKADKKFSKIRDLPYYERSRYNTYFYKVFKVYTKLWKFQQENRHKLVEAGVKRWEIGEIASRIAQLYYGQYMRTSDASYLKDSFVFYEAILNREYFDCSIQSLNMTNKQLRFLARFMMVCLVMNRREKLHQLISQLKMMVDECKRTFQETDFKEWKVVLQEIIRFLKADANFMNIRPLRYSIVIDPDPDSMPRVSCKRSLKLRDAILSSYYRNEIKFSDMSLDTFRMLQSLEWEPSGSFYQPSVKAGPNDGQVPSRINHSNEIVDPTLPLNPRKAILYRPSSSCFLAVLATICEELPSDGILLIYLSASVSRGSNTEVPPNSSDEIKEECLYFGCGNDGVINGIYPTDIIPFTRKPLFIIIDSDGSDSFKVIHGSEKGESAAILLSPSCSPPLTVTDSNRYQNGTAFTLFLTAPLQAFCLLVGLSGPDINMDTYDKADALLNSIIAELSSTLAASDGVHPVWAQSLNDPFLRRLFLRFVICHAVMTSHVSTFGRPECHPQCLPVTFLPPCQLPVRDLANIFGVVDQFKLSYD